MLRLHRVSRAYGQRLVFTGLDADVPAGARLLLDGPNGSGKTTLLRCVAGVLGVSAGRILVGGYRAGSLPARRLVGACLGTAPDAGLYSALSGHDNLLLAARIRLPWRQAAAAVATVEDELDLTAFRGVAVERCSAGMRARLALARALLAEPALLLLDEPTRSLDAPARAALWAALARRPTLTCVIASHQEDDRMRCDRRLDLTAAR